MLQSTEINNSTHGNIDMGKRKLQNIVHLINPSMFLLRFYYGQFYWFGVRFREDLILDFFRYQRIPNLFQ